MRKSLFLAALLPAMTGCMTPTVGGLNHQQYVRAKKGQGTRRAVPASFQDVYDSIVESWQKSVDQINQSGAGSIRASVSKEESAVFFDMVDNAPILGISAGTSYAAYLYPSAQENSTDLEVVVMSPILGEEKSRGMEGQFFSGIAEAAELKKLRRGSAPQGSAAAQPAAPRLAPAAAPAAQSDVDQFPGKRVASRPDDYALVVGIGAYQSLPSADFGERDAETVRRYLIGLGVPEENVIVLTGARATLTGMAKYLEEWLPRNATSQSRVFFYYSGHGAPDPAKGDAYLVPWDGDPTFLKSSAYPVARVYQQLAALKAKEILVALDACFSGAGGRSVIAKGARPLVTVAEAKAPGDPRFAILSASSGEEIAGSLEEQSHGLFTYHLLKGLGGEADADKDGHVSAQELHAFVRSGVARGARRQNREQTPQLHAPNPAIKFY